MSEARWWRYFSGYWEEDDIYEHFQVAWTPWGLECYIWATEEDRDQIKNTLENIAMYFSGESNCQNLTITTTLTV